MPLYVPKFKAVFEDKIIENTLAIVKRDMKLALDYFYPLDAAGAPLLDSSVARAVGVTVLHMDGFTTKPEEGDLFTIAGDTQVYEVISSTALIGTDSDVTFRPGLKVAIPAVDGNEVVTFSGLPDFRQRTLGLFTDLAYPKLAIDPVKNASDQSDDDSHLDEVLRVDIFISVTDTDAPGVTKRLIKYCRALDAVLRTATKEDYLAGIDANKIFGWTLELEHDYALIGGNAKDGYARPASFELTMKFSEL